jgi:hypothetical protein
MPFLRRLDILDTFQILRKPFGVEISLDHHLLLKLHEGQR